MKSKLDKILQGWNLLTHPFYQSWSAGTLPVEALRVYAAEYGAYIASLPAAWETVGETETAREEREHALLWERFVRALGSDVAGPALAETKELAATAADLFVRPATALGALYAFEVQQPETASSKLRGLKTHYNFPPDAEHYFEVHSSNWHESQRILELIAVLPPGQQAEALVACETMGRALWNALTGVHRSTCMN